MLPRRNDLKPILLWVVAPFSISHTALWVSTLSLRSLTRACGSIGFYQTHVSNSSQHSNEPLGSERAGDEGRQVGKWRKWRKSRGKGKAKVRQIIMEDIWRWGNSHSLLKKFKNWFWSFYCSHRQQWPNNWIAILVSLYWYILHELPERLGMLSVNQKSGTRLAKRKLTEFESHIKTK